MAGVIDTLRATVRGALGLPADPGAPPDLMRLGLYRARVDAVAADGSTLDVTPEDKRISAEKGVPVRVGIPGAVAVVQAGAVVLLGWERGDPGRPYCVPSWESGATVTKLVLKASTVYLGDEAGADSVALASKVATELGKVKTTLDSLSGASFTTPYATPGSVAAAQAKAK